MYCVKCGNKINDTDSFCPNCKTEIKKELDKEIISNENYNSIDNIPENVKESNDINSIGESRSFDKKSSFSLALGIISLILGFLYNIYILPVAIIGLILGFTCAKKANMKLTAIIVNIISVIIILGLYFYYYEKNDLLFGNYNCTNQYGNSGYSITLNLYKDKTFLYGPYNRMTNNYVKGTFDYKILQKSNASGNARYYSLSLNAKKQNYVVNGIQSDHDFISRAEIGFEKHNGVKQGVLVFESSSTLYFCYENK